ncbi:hypothetical protein E3E31_11300 [Thermococcus sp. M39]|uniref:hypothetical protein n=1 Tax=unclassified Thermococcus TaxID=2627626 RepID=UPI00143C15D9|nr:MULTISPECIES: hypothetical protein [unclassified Thermococcus]NJE09098.1 hypothetical protein [Thermococcus sp. M39]NJE12047.1 hypothetical protein [Thermococcus sp. LS2]
MENLKLIQKKLEVVRKQKELLMLEEAKLVRMLYQRKAGVSKKLAVVKREKFMALAQEAKLLRILKQNGKTLAI